MTIKPMLAVDVDYNKLRLPVWVSSKLDGIRMIVKDGVCLSRSLKPIPNKYVQELFSDLESADGELIVGDLTDPKVFSNTTSGVMSVEGTPDVTFYVFDRWDVPERPYEDRRNMLGGYAGNNSFILNSTFVETMEDLEWMIHTAAENGLEGLILRAPEKGYKYGRSTKNQQHLLKVKFFEDDEFVVEGFEEEYENTNESKVNELGYAERSSSKAGMKPKGRLGKLIVSNDHWKDLKVGSGFTHTERQELWDERDSLIGRTVKVKYQSVGIKDKPRLPIFIGWRDERDM